MTMSQILNDLWSFVNPKQVFDPHFDPQKTKPEPKTQKLTSGHRRRQPFLNAQNPNRYINEKPCPAKQNLANLDRTRFGPCPAILEAAPDTLQAVSDSTIPQGFTGAQLNQHLQAGVRVCSESV
jgi:hypothetical protein